MSTKMKGLLKGLRYISQIFEEDGKEPEMQIGFPTDVKHVAHIGWDGPSVTSPSWMNEFKGPSSEAGNTTAEAKQDSSITKSKQEKHRPSKQHQSTSPVSPLNSPSRRTRRNHRFHDSTTNDTSSSSPKSGNGSTTKRHSRRHHHHHPQNTGVTISQEEGSQPDSPKKSHRRSRRSKCGSSGGGSITRQSKSNDQKSSLDAAESGFGSGSGHRLKNTVFEEKKECQ